MSWHLYRCYDAEGWLLYIGETGHGVGRFHNRDRVNAEWSSRIARVTFEEYDTATLAKEAERRAIETEHPIYNVQHAIGSPAWRAERQCQVRYPRRQGKHNRKARKATRLRIELARSEIASVLRAVDAARNEGDTGRAIGLYVTLDKEVKYMVGCLVCHAPAQANPMCTTCFATYRREVLDPRNEARHQHYMKTWAAIDKAAGRFVDQPR